MQYTTQYVLFVYTSTLQGQLPIQGTGLVFKHIRSYVSQKLGSQEVNDLSTI